MQFIIFNNSTENIYEDMKLSASAPGQQAHEGEKKCLNSELWHACAGPLVSLPILGSRVVYFPQGHSEQVAATTNRDVDAHIPNYPSLPPQLICQLHNVTMHADVETDEVYAQMTLQPLTPQEQKDTYVPIELGMPGKQPTNYFCKTLTASDTSTHGGFSVPRRAAEKVFPPLDFSQQPPCQELIARDLHDVEWKFKHIFRGQPKRHLLTTGWSVFVSAKRLIAGDSVLFIWNEKNQLLLGIRRAVRPQTVMPSSVLSSDSMHIGLLAAAAHAAATNSCFTIFYNPRASPSEFVIALSKYVKAVYHTRVSVGMRFRMLFETEESSVRRYMGTITGIGGLDPVRWSNSHWRSVKVGWDESTAGERQPRVSLWEIEPLTTFPMYPSLFPLRLKRPWYPGASSFQDGREGAINGMTWLRGETEEQGLHSLNFQNVGMLPWTQQRLDTSLVRNDFNPQYEAMLAAGLHTGGGDSIKQQFLQLQQPFQYLQQPGGQSLVIQPSISSNILQTQAQMLQQANNQPEEQPQQQTYQDSFLIQSDQLQNRQQTNVPSPSFSKTDFADSNAEFFTSVGPCVRNMLGSFCTDGRGNHLHDLTRTGQTMVSNLSEQQWLSKFTNSQVHLSTNNSVSFPPYPGKEPSIEQENGSLESHKHSVFGATANNDSGLLLPTALSGVGDSAVNSDASSMALVSSGFRSAPHGCMQDSSELLLSAEAQVGPPTPARTFVKVYKSGSVGRVLDITRFNSYHELREELGHMFGIEGLLEDPQRSGWQLVIVDRENDVLLLGDDPWEEFVNNVWYIKILSPVDVLRLGKQETESFSHNNDARMNHENGNGGQDFVSGLPSVGSLGY